MSRIDASHWAVGVRGLAGQFSQSLLVLVDGETQGVLASVAVGTDAREIEG